MRRFVVGFFTVVGLIVVLLVIGGAIAWRVLVPREPTIASSTVLSLELGQSLAETSPSDPYSRFFFEETPSLRDVLDALQRAGDDTRIKGVFAHIAGNEIGTASVQELREAIAAFRAKGKFAIAFADTFGEFSPGNRGYYLATAFDEIWLQPLGAVGLVGLRLESPFFRGTLDKLGIVPRLDHRSEYKSAMNMMTDKEMGAPQREEYTAIVDSISGQIRRDVATARHIGEAELDPIVDAGPYQASDADRLHLVDHVGYRDQAIAAARTRAGGTAALLRPLAYLDRAGRPNREGPTIALIYGTGVIQRGESTDNPVSGSGVLGAESVAHAFRSALADPKVRAILFRINSPGGSAVASETIWRETVRAREANIPVIVSMGDVAGSGGYYIAAAADKIVAQPATLTGSIGVVAGKMLVGGLWDKLGVTWGSVQQGSNAGMFSTIEDYTPAGERHFQSFLDTVYAGFKDRVAAGRRLDKSTVETIARGRVWTGEDAKTRGLVDALGGYDTALRLARVAAHLDAEAPITLQTYPPERAAGEQILAHLLGRDGDEEGQARTGLSGGLLGELTRLAALLRPVLHELEALTAPAGSLTMKATETPR
ncbi:MAG TPA: signal peptide peptidase SppA [Stellaceae bacterium]|nr:signal peptide peptidase SppA [Stellaceae bacterium]